jgi:hypothetical protein
MSGIRSQLTTEKDGKVHHDSDDNRKDIRMNGDRNSTLRLGRAISVHYVHNQGWWKDSEEAVQ